MRPPDAFLQRQICTCDPEHSVSIRTSSTTLLDETIICTIIVGYIAWHCNLVRSALSARFFDNRYRSLPWTSALS